MLIRRLLIPAVAALSFAMDMASKHLAVTHLQPGQTMPFIPGFLQLTLTTNTGSAFGIAKDAKDFVTLMAIAICSGIIIWTIKRQQSTRPFSLMEQCAIGLILGGAIGNIGDRLLHGCVTDFLEFSFFSFPVFNVADALLDTGAVLLILNSWTSKEIKTQKS